MIGVSIGSEQRDLRDVTSAWLRSSLDHLRHAGPKVCVKVRIDVGEIDMILTTVGCPCGDGARPFRGEEKKIFETWKSKRLDTDQFTPRDLEEFLGTVRKL